MLGKLKKLGLATVVSGMVGLSYSAYATRIFEDSFETGEATNKILTGQFLDSAVENVRYFTSSGMEGFTNSKGQYQYREGDKVEFFIGDVTLGKVTADGLLTVYDFEFDVQISQFLQTLDRDNLSANGIQIDPKLHDSPLFKKGTAAGLSNAAQITKDLNVKYFSANDENKRLVKDILSGVGLLERDILVQEVAKRHADKAQKLKRIKMFWPELYRYIDGSEAIPQWHNNSNVHNDIFWRIAYYFYFNGRINGDGEENSKSFQELLNAQTELHWDAIHNIHASQEKINNFAKRFANTSGLVTEALSFVVDKVGFSASDEGSNQTKRRIFNATLSSGKSEVNNLLFSGAMGELIDIAENCVVGLDLSWPSVHSGVDGVINNVLSETAKRTFKTALKVGASKVFNCSVGEVVKATARFINAYKGKISIQEWQYYKIAEIYLDGLFKCGGNEDCMSSLFGNARTRWKQLDEIIKTNQLDTGIDASVKIGAIIVIEEYFYKVAKISSTIQESIPQELFSNFSQSNIEKWLDIQVSPINIDEDKSSNTKFGFRLYARNRSYEDAYISDISAKFTVLGGGQYQGSSSYYTKEYLRSTPIYGNGNLLEEYLALNLGNIDLPDEGIMSIAFEVTFYEKGDSTNPLTVRKNYDVDIAALKNSNMYDILSAKKISLYQPFYTAKENSTFVLPAISLGGKRVESKDTKWAVNSGSLSKYPILSVGKNSEGKHIVNIPNLRSGFSSDVVVLNASVSTSRYSKPVMFVLTIVKDETLEPPQMFTGEVWESNSVILWWEPSENVKVTGYEISMKGENSDSYQVVKRVPDRSEMNYRVDGLEANKTYSFQIRSVASNDKSEPAVFIQSMNLTAPVSARNHLGSYYKFDINWKNSGEGSDAVGKNNVGFTAGKKGTALNLTESEDYVAIPFSASQMATFNRSITFWIKPSATQAENWSYILSRNSNGNGFSVIYDKTANGIRFRANNISLSAPLNVDKWNHVAITKNSANRFTLYVNGQKKQAITLSGFTEVNGAPMIVGAKGIPYQNRGQLNAALDELRFYDATLTGAEVLAEYEALKDTTLINWITNPANGHQYTALNCGTWTQCQAKAVELGGNLVTIRSAAENQWLVDNFDSSKNYWIGFTDKDVEGDWKWISGEAVTYENWNAGEPNNSNNGEHHAHMNYNFGNIKDVGKWNDTVNDWTNGLILGLVEKTTDSSVDNWLYFFINGQMKKIIPEGYSGRITKIGTWWGNHSVRLDLNNNGNIDLDFNEGYPTPEIDHETYNFSFSNGFSVQDYKQWTSYWHDETHGKVRCWVSDCRYDPKGVGFLMDLDDTGFKCIRNVWTYNGQLVNNKELYCRSIAVQRN